MGVGNKATRKTAIPFRARTWDDDVEVTIGDGAGNSGQIRMCRPYKGEIIEAKMLWWGLASDGMQLRLYFGEFEDDGVTAKTSYSESKIARDHKLITGFNAPINYGFMGNIFLDGLSLTKGIPQHGDPDFNPYGFILGIEIDGATIPEFWQLFEFKVDCTVQMGVL